MRDRHNLSTSLGTGDVLNKFVFRRQKRLFQNKNLLCGENLLTSVMGTWFAFIIFPCVASLQH